ncbi:hypothetical protein G7Y79_00073g098430 [Physcia stellaris]|nr:hypothetical protein G7Y79_00073g098430 [Physcia stellaris]
MAASGPETIEAIVQAHRSVCSRVRSLLESLPLNVPRDSDWPSPESVRLLPLYEAVILLFDDYGPEEHWRGSAGQLLLDEEMQRRNVLIILTGDDGRLSSPISLDCIKAYALPTNRDDVLTNNNFDVIRVSLKTAVRFIAQAQYSQEIGLAALEKPTTAKPSALTCISSTLWLTSADGCVGRPDTFVVDYLVDLMGSAGEVGEGSSINDSN